MEHKFTTIRVPIEVREKAEELREILKAKNKKLKFVNLSLGAVVGYAVTFAIKKEKKV